MSGVCVCVCVCSQWGTCTYWLTVLDSIGGGREVEGDCCWEKNKVNWDGNGLVCSSVFLSVHPNCVDPHAGPQSSWHVHSGAVLGNSLGFGFSHFQSTQERQPHSMVKPSPSRRGCQCIQFWVVTAPRCPTWFESLRTGCLTVTCRLYVKAPFTAWKIMKLPVSNVFYFRGFTHLNLEIHILNIWFLYKFWCSMSLWQCVLSFLG